MNFTPIAIGIFMILFRKFLAKQAIKSQNQFWGFHFGPKEIKGSEYVLIITGAFFIVLGSLDSF